MGLVGRTLIALGILMFGFIAYLLWGTGLETARAQRDLSDRFEQSLAAADPGPDTSGDPGTDPGADDDGTQPDDTSPGDTSPGDTNPDATSPSDASPDATSPDVTDPDTGSAVPDPDQLGVDQGIGPFEPGEPVARLEIPSLGIDEIIVAGVGVSELKLGPGHFPETPLPGQYGRASIAGHRTTYGQPFRYIDRLVPGDLMITTTQAGRFVYEVTDSLVVLPTDYQVVNTTFPEFANLTLVSCHPAFSSSRRLVVNGMLVSELSDPVGRATPYASVDDGTLPTEEPGDTGTDESAGTGGTDGPDATPDTANPDTATPDTPAPDTATPDTATPDTATPDGTVGDAPVDTGGSIDQPAASLDDAFGDGWFDDPGAPAQVALWGAVLAAIGLLSFLISRAARRDLVGLGLGLVPFSIAAFFFFVNVHRLLPAGL